MAKFQLLDYLEESERKEFLKYEILLHAAENIQEFKKYDSILDDYRELARLRMELKKVENEIEEILHANNSLVIEDGDEENEEDEEENKPKNKEPCLI